MGRVPRANAARTMSFFIATALRTAPAVLTRYGRVNRHRGDRASGKHEDQRCEKKKLLHDDPPVSSQQP